MRRIFSLSILAVSLLLLSGCSATNVSKFITAAGKDQATWKIHVMTPYGSGDYTRIGKMEPGQSATVNSDGSITITSSCPSGGSNLITAPMKADVSIHQ